MLNLYKQGSSLGGARPKANVRDIDGSLWIAKIPSINDDYDVALWEFWSPAYDLNPSDFNTQSLLISRDSNESSLEILLAAAGDYMLSADRAKQIIDEIRMAMNHAHQVARQCGISDREMTRFPNFLINNP